MRRGKETCLVLGGGEVDAFPECCVEVAGEGSGIAPLGVLEVSNWPLAEIEAEHGANPLEGYGLPKILTNYHITIFLPI